MKYLLLAGFLIGVRMGSGQSVPPALDTLLLKKIVDTSLHFRSGDFPKEPRLALLLISKEAGIYQLESLYATSPAFDLSNQQLLLQKLRKQPAGALPDTFSAVVSLEFGLAGNASFPSLAEKQAVQKKITDLRNKRQLVLHQGKMTLSSITCSSISTR
ncbi:hypothetical protein ACD591_07800 [Rufibacter glacialis]|uniref:Uncharacterized protein n=1 Tax=Rufibacter glacialis TaxID=1259555 RepID=A0A5M8QBZ9_9BACT|nr:hypothetical protein [Rufibacter glacialis]KAA6433535.1 hypothetical protein FOE74_13825 [Rufibacter glacialis]